MKDFHWYIVFGTILLTPFLPILLKAKCPACGKRKLHELETVPPGHEELPESEKNTFVTFFLCENCGKRWKRVRTLKLQPAEDPVYEFVFAKH